MQRLLKSGANPNFSYDDVTPWQYVMVAAVSHFTSLEDLCRMHDSLVDEEWMQIAKAWVHIFEIFVKYGADPNALTKKRPTLLGHPRFSPLVIVKQYFPEALSEEAAKLRVVLEEQEI